jgi:predicted HicB family RNase H-like nuclease
MAANEIKTIKVRIPADDYEAVKLAAAKDERSINNYIVVTLRKAAAK